MSKKGNFAKSLGYATAGVKDAIIDEPNLKIHLAVAVLVIVVAVLIHVDTEKLAILVLTISSVIILELVNTIIEKIIDFISPGYSRQAKVIKDISAGIVLIAALTAVVVGVIVFGSYFFTGTQ